MEKEVQEEEEEAPVDEEDLAGVPAVHGHQLPHEDLVGTRPVLDLEPEDQPVRRRSSLGFASRLGQLRFTHHLLGLVAFT